MRKYCRIIQTTTKLLNNSLGSYHFKRNITFLRLELRGVEPLTACKPTQVRG